MVWVPLLVALVLLTALVLPLHVFPVLLAPKWLVYARGACVQPMATRVYVAWAGVLLC